MYNISYFQVLTDYNEYLEGVKIWFNGTSINRPALDIHKVQQSNVSFSIKDFRKYENFTMTTVHNSGSSSHVLTGLLPYAQYDVFLMPFYKLLLGKPSNLKTGFTEEDGKHSNSHLLNAFHCESRVAKLYVYILVPSDPPQSVTAGVINATSAWIRWDPPPVHTWNGEISGYLVSTYWSTILLFTA